MSFPCRVRWNRNWRHNRPCRKLVTASGCNYVICACAWGTLSREQSMRSLRLFADKIMPAVAAA